MDTLLKETVNATVNSRYPGMAPEGRKLIEDILIRKELEKGELLFKEGQVCHHMVYPYFAGRKAQSHIAVLFRGNERYRNCRVAQYTEKYNTVQTDKLF